MLTMVCSASRAAESLLFAPVADNASRSDIGRAVTTSPVEKESIQHDQDGVANSLGSVAHSP